MHKAPSRMHTDAVSDKSGKGPGRAVQLTGKKEKEKERREGGMGRSKVLRRIRSTG